MPITAFPSKSSGGPELQRVITTTGNVDLGTIRNCYIILTGGGGGGAGAGNGGTALSGSGGGAAGAVGGPMLFRTAHATIGAGGAGGSAGLGAGSGGGDSYLTRMGTHAGSNQSVSASRIGVYMAAAGGAGAPGGGGATAGSGANPGGPTISGVNTYVFLLGSPGGSVGGASTTVGNTINADYTTQGVAINYLQSWKSNWDTFFNTSSSTTGSGETTRRPPFGQVINTNEQMFINMGGSQMLRFTSGSVGGVTLPYAGPSAISQSNGINGGNSLFCGAGGTGGGSSNFNGGVGGSNMFFDSPARATGATNAGGGGGGGAGAASAGAAGANATSGVGGAGGSGGLGGGSGGGGGVGTTGAAGGAGGSGALLIFF